MLITESGVGRGHCASWLSNATDPTVYRVTYADAAMACGKNWKSPWRVAIVGGLSDVVESTLVTDVAEPAVFTNTEWVQPGPASWIYWAYNHGSKDFRIVKDYIDLAVEMHWPYVLIDWEWAEMTNGGNVHDALAYAKEKGVKPLLWYNSSTAWKVPTPLYRLNTPQARRKEYQWLNDSGVYGVKVDFFNGDHVETIDYILDILEDAVDAHQLVTLHGVTIPRGWQRTYPHLMTLEAVLGAEWYNNNGILTGKAPVHNATIPFTRNVIGSMDYTPGTFSDSQHPHHTTNAHELALTVLFESALQHMPDRPSSYAALPPAVRSILRHLPSAWTDTKLLSGYPGKDVVIARRKADKWYVAGVNGENCAKTITVDLSKLGHLAKSCTLVCDGETPAELNVQTDMAVKKSVEIECAPAGGFLMVL